MAEGWVNVSENAWGKKRLCCYKIHKNDNVIRKWIKVAYEIRFIQKYVGLRLKWDQSENLNLKQIILNRISHIMELEYCLWQNKESIKNYSAGRNQPSVSKQEEIVHLQNAYKGKCQQSTDKFERKCNWMKVVCVCSCITAQLCYSPLVYKWRLFWLEN